MQKVFLTSDFGCTKKVNGIRQATSIDNKNGLVDKLKEKLVKTDNFVFICSSPDNYDKNDSYANLTFKGFELTGFNFERLIIVDSRYSGNLSEDIEKADIVFLSGGHTPTEMRFFESLGLRDLLKSYQGIIVGQSAGSLNLAETVVCAPEYEEEIGGQYIWPGLGKTNINVEPHFTETVPLGLDTIIREELLKLTEDYPLYALCDGSYIYDDGQTATLYGEAYYLSKGQITNICTVGKSVVLENKRRLSNKR